MPKLKRSKFRPVRERIERLPKERRERIEADAREMANVVRSDRTKDRETGGADLRADGLD